ncbi:hypothetical protein V8B55DRAFT_1461086 [Mucor lusitanicus]|uniref:F-box domain-containing protein n=2 Tax=Mucor circinelloides f. lusitanicus TaxID=29924 RepID=A0A168KMS6_MUCCL|nr:hypothetical protein FB192DRAFT_1442342 [Mucor lusitanicus]OAD02568.1 hypothetical protein MUCCIDRAFT_111958 [Mucor lusitanicus CBS 277.49]
MDRLPLEIYNQITSYLTFSEKRKLLLVCRYWHNRIKNGNLFNNFGIKGHHKFEAAALFFDANASHRKQVRSLRLTKPEADLDYVLTVPERFPWIKDFVWAHYGAHQEETAAITHARVDHWNNLTSFGEANRYPLATDILKQGGFSNLTKLTISFHFSGASCGALVQQLANAPKLTHIDFASPTMALMDLEQLHLNAPQLEILYLSGVVQEEDGFLEGHGFEVVGVASHLTTLWMRNMNLATGGFGLTNAWMSYMATKYGHLDCLTIDGVGMTRGRQDYYESRLTDIAAGCPHLTTYKVNLFPLTSRIVSAMDSNQVKLKRIDLTGDPTEDQIQHLLRSRQCQSLQTITMENTQLAPEQLFSALEGFSKLRHVEIGYKHRQSVSLDVVLQKLRYLETLKLSTWHIWLDKHAASTIQTRLRSLVLEKSDIDTANENVMSFLASTCPDLSRLSIQGRIQEGGGNTVFRVEFPHHYFTAIKLDIFGNEYYRVSNQRQTTWYQFSARKLLASHQDNQAIPQDQPHVSIVYQGSANLNIGGTDIPNW